MALTLAQRNQLRKRAAKEAAAVAPAALMEGATGYEVMLAKLQQDQFRLKQVQSTEGKGKLKAELLPEYAPYIEGALSAGQGAQDRAVADRVRQLAGVQFGQNLVLMPTLAAALLGLGHGEVGGRHGYLLSSSADFLHVQPY